MHPADRLDKLLELFEKLEYDDIVSKIKDNCKLTNVLSTVLRTEVDKIRKMCMDLMECVYGLAPDSSEFQLALNLLSQLENPNPAIEPGTLVLKYSQLSESLIALRDSYFLPLVPYVKANGRWMNVFNLDPVLVNVYDEAIKIYKTINKKDSLQAAYLRRLINNALNGGVLVDLLNDIEKLPLHPENFERLVLPMQRAADIVLPSAEQLEEFAEDYLENVFEENGTTEANLRFHFWDPFIRKLVRMVQKNDGELEKVVRLISELDIKKMLRTMGQSYKIDVTGILKTLNDVVLLVEDALEMMTSHNSHKDFGKLCPLGIKACIKLAQKFFKAGVDVALIKIFGLLVGGSKFQPFVLHPILTLIDETKKSYIIRVIVSFNPHWNGDLFALDDPKNDVFCVAEVCCNTKSSTFFVKALDPQSPRQVPYAEEPAEKRSKLSFEEDVDCDTLFENTPPQLPRTKKIHEFSLRKLLVFLNAFVAHSRVLSNVDLSKDRDDGATLDVSTFMHVTRSLAKDQAVTPEDKRAEYERKTPSTPTKGGDSTSSLFEIKKPPSEGYDLYNLPGFGIPFFPHLHSLRHDFKDGQPIYVITMEKMSPLLGEGGFGFGGEVDAFGSMIRAGNGYQLLMEALTFTLHTLHGLYLLHEKYMYVHADISPTNIMFSSIGGIWKLTDFDTCMPIEKSLKTVRRCGTPGLIAPESEETGIFTKASDIFSLGCVLRYTFGIQLIHEFEMDNGNERLELDFRTFMNIIIDMTAENSAKRSSCLRAMYECFELLQGMRHPMFPIHGEQFVFPCIKQLLAANRDAILAEIQPATINVPIKKDVSIISEKQIAQRLHSTDEPRDESKMINSIQGNF